MAFTSDIQKVVDNPMWQYLKDAPGVSSSDSFFYNPFKAEDSRYLYFGKATSMYRYDTVTDSWMYLTSLSNFQFQYGLYNLGDGVYTDQHGFRGRILNATSNTFIGAGIQGKILKGKKLRIYAGKGVGQERTIKDVSFTPKIYDHGVATATTNVNQIQDTTKKWKINQWVGYQVRLIYGTGETQMRRILYNTSNLLRTFYAYHQPYEPFNNQAFATSPVSTAGSETHYQIEASVYTIDKPWDIIPDDTSRFVLDTGGIFMITLSTTGAPYYTLGLYDFASNVVQNKTSEGSGYALVGTSFTSLSIEQLHSNYNSFVTGSITSATNRVIRFNNNISSSLDRWVNYTVTITSGSGFPQTQRIVANTTSSLEIAGKWNPLPGTGSQFSINANKSMLYMNLYSTTNNPMIIYDTEKDTSSNGQMFDYGLARNMAIQKSGSQAFAVTSATRYTGGITTVNNVPTAKGTGYSVGDVLTITTGGNNGKVYVETISTGGLVETVSLYAVGQNYTTGVGKTTSGGTGTGCTIEITSVGVVGTISTPITTFLKIGDVITFTGATESAWNTTYTIIGIDNGIDVTTTATANAVATNTNSTTLFVDCTKNWVTNEHVGKLVYLYTDISFTGANPIPYIFNSAKRITGNTETTLTLQSDLSTPITNGSGKYVIQDPYCLGRDQLYWTPEKSNMGYATSGSKINLVDATKNWNVNQWSGSKFRIVAGTGRDNEITVTSNTSTRLNFATQTFSPDKTSKYIVMDTFGLCTAGSTTTLTDSTKNWPVNRWVGKRVRITSGTAIANEYTITSNTSNTLTFALATAPSTDSTYTIIGTDARALGSKFVYISNSSDFSKKGKYIFCAKGGGSIVHNTYDITTDMWSLNLISSPQFETLTTGTMYVYDPDSKDIIYITKDSTGKVLAYNVLNKTLDAVGSIPSMGTATLGNKFNIIKTPDGLKYFYVLRNGSTTFWRSLIF